MVLAIHTHIRLSSVLKLKSYRTNWDAFRSAVMMIRTPADDSVDVKKLIDVLKATVITSSTNSSAVKLWRSGIEEAVSRWIADKDAVGTIRTCHIIMWFYHLAIHSFDSIAEYLAATIATSTFTKSYIAGGPQFYFFLLHSF